MAFYRVISPIGTISTFATPVRPSPVPTRWYHLNRFAILSYQSLNPLTIFLLGICLMNSWTLTSLLTYLTSFWSYCTCTRRWWAGFTETERERECFLDIFSSLLDKFTSLLTHFTWGRRWQWAGCRDREKWCALLIYFRLFSNISHLIWHILCGAGGGGGLGAETSANSSASMLRGSVVQCNAVCCSVV